MDHAKISAYIFDLDGTLLDSEVLWVEATLKTLRDHDAELSHADVLQMVYGKSWHDVFQAINDRFSDINKSLKELEADMRRHFTAMRDSRDVCIAGSIKLLKQLAENYPVCIVSGSPREDLDAAVDLMQVGDYLRFTLAAEDYAPGKPAPAGFLKAAEMLSVKPAQCVVFEDSAAGVAAARAAGMYCVALARPDAPPQDVAKAHLVMGCLESFTPDMLTR